MKTFILDEINKLICILNKIQQEEKFTNQLMNIGALCVKALQNKGKIIFAGNGGSAADAQHLAAELMSRLRYNRPGLAAIAITTDTSALTAIGNDYSFEYIFSRQIESLAQPGDVFIGISTSGKSPNILRALATAREKQLVTVGFTGMNGLNMADYCNELICVPATETPKIQECHIMFGHIICALIEENIYGDEYNPAKKELVI